MKSRPTASDLIGSLLLLAIVAITVAVASAALSGSWGAFFSAMRIAAFMALGQLAYHKWLQDCAARYKDAEDRYEAHQPTRNDQAMSPFLSDDIPVRRPKILD